MQEVVNCYGFTPFVSIISSNHLHFQSSNSKRKMSRNYDNWERLVAAVVKKQQLLQLFHAQSRSPSVLSDASDFSSISALEEGDVSFDPYPYNLHQAQAPVNEYEKNQGIVFISEFEPIFDLEDLLTASPEILGVRTFGSVFAAKLENGTTIAVKRLKTVNISEQDFKIHMGIVGDVKHENVAELRAYYYSKDEKLMIYDYYSARSVFALLHGKTGVIRARVDWQTRLRIVIGAARGISHIHTHNGGNLVHGNIKASNIFLNSQGYGVVSGLGSENMIPTFPQSSRCYAPEVKHTQNVSQASDVYSFGILLLELLTRKSPEPSPDHEAVDLVKFVNSISREEWNTSVFDGDLLVNPSIREEILRMLEIGLSCVAKSPKKRPKMSAVVKMIEEIHLMNVGNQSKLVNLGSGYTKFYIDDLLRASAEFLGNGTIGTSYKATLENGIIVYVKRLKDVIVTNEEFQQHVEVNGRIGHKNVAEVKAYYYSRDEKLLVYHHYSQGSLSARLHGGRDSGKRPMKWNTRLRIAVDAARGIARVHTKNGQKLVHGNIRASNILLYNQQFGIVSDVGLGKLVSPKTFSVTRNAGYCAPEVTDSRMVSQASDVYSFGVVLLELLSGQLPQTTYKGVVMSLVNRTHAVVREEWASQVFDVELLRYENVEEDLVGMMQIAMHCVAILPETRPKMHDVVKMLEEIGGV